MKIKYEFVNREIIEIEVPDGIGEISIAIDKEICNSDRRETRRHESYSAGNDKQEVLEDLSVTTKVKRSLKRLKRGIWSLNILTISVRRWRHDKSIKYPGR